MPLLNAVVDLSHHNTVTDFTAARAAGVLGVLHKATEATTFVDAMYHERRSLALAAGLLWGAYHFAAAGDGPAQADFFLETVNPQPTDLLVLDFEANSREGTMTLAEAEAFVKRIEQQTGRFPGLYSGEQFLLGQLGDNTGTVLKECFLWLARYSQSPPAVPKAFATFTLWQYTDGSSGSQPHQVSGIGLCDRDKFNGDEAGLRRLWGVSA
jgi:lysozyme